MNDVETFPPFQFWLLSDARLGISHTPGSHPQSHAPVQCGGSATRPPSSWCSEETPWHRAWCLQVSAWFCWAKCWHAGLQWWASALAKQMQTTGCHPEPLFLPSSPLFCCLLGPWQSFLRCYLNNLVPTTVFTSVFFSLKQVEPRRRVHQLQLAQAKECLHVVFWIWPEAEPYRIIACWLCQVVPASAFAAWLSLKVAGSSSCLC